MKTMKLHVHQGPLPLSASYFGQDADDEVLGDAGGDQWPEREGEREGDHEDEIDLSELIGEPVEIERKP